MALDKEETTERVLQIAGRLLEEGGAPNLKARTVAQEAGIAIGSVYNMFGDLAGLHREVNMQLLDELGRRGSLAMADLQSRGVTNTRERLLTLAHAYRSFVLDHPGAWAALLAYNRGRIHEREPDAYLERLDTLFEIIARVLADADPAISPGTLRLTARTLWSSVHGIVTSGYAARSGQAKADEIREQVELLVTTFLRGMKDQSASTT